MEKEGRMTKLLEEVLPLRNRITISTHACVYSVTPCEIYLSIIMLPLEGVITHEKTKISLERV